MGANTKLNSSWCYIESRNFECIIVFGHDITIDEVGKHFYSFLHDKDTSMFPPDIRRVGFCIDWILESSLEFILLFRIIELMLTGRICGHNAKNKQI